MSRNVLVTGANKGIGLALVRRCLIDQQDTKVILACRNKQRGDEAVDGLGDENPEWRARLTLLVMDTSRDTSVAEAAESLKAQLGTDRLYCIVNNAGIAEGSISDVLQVNVHGPHRVDAAFLPLLQEGGRIVNISSGAGPRCVQGSSAERRKFLMEARTWEELCSVMDELEKCSNTKQGLNAIGIGVMSGPGDAIYAVSKALLNCYTAQMAKDNPQIKINACSPGAIATDLFKSFKCACLLKCFFATPDQGTRSAMHLMFADLEGNGCFYHKTATKRPFDKY